MTAKVRRFAALLLLLSLSGCADLASLLSTPTPVPASQASATPQPVLNLTSTTAPPIEARILRIWLPPRFDPASGSDSANLLKQRLNEFEASHRGLKLDVRIKAETGDSSLTASLSLTRTAAPSALPDLIALSRADLESAASQGLLHPMDGLSTVLDDPNWHPYARELGHFQNIGYGLPFAGDALVFLHSPDLAINNWEEILAAREPLLFPAGDPQALVPLSLYLSAGGGLVNEQGAPALEEEPLTQVLTLLRDGLEVEAFSPSMLSLETDQAAFRSYREGWGRMIITWASNHRETSPSLLQPIPGLVEGSPQAIADGWMWALAGATPENQQLATELAEFLMDPAYLNEWTRETGYLPTRITGQETLNPIIESARVLPSREVLAVLSPIMNRAVSRVLNGEQVPAVVRSVLEEVP